MDQRASERARTLLAGRVIFNDRSSVIDCIVRDLSSGGARIAFDYPVSIPDRFELEIPRRNISTPVRITWSDAREHGVAFLTAEQAPAQKASADDPASQRRHGPGAGDAMTAGEAVVEALTALLADHLALHVATRGLYWQMQSNGSAALQRALGEQSRALLTAMDRIAERVHASGGDGLSSLEQAAQLTSIQQDDMAVTRSRARADALLSGTEALLTHLAKAHRISGRYADTISIELINELSAEAESRRSALVRLRLDPTLS